MMYSDGSIERHLSERRNMQHMHVREETWDVMYQDATDGEGAAQCNLILRAHLSETRYETLMLWLVRPRQNAK